MSHERTRAFRGPRDFGESVAKTANYANRPVILSAPAPADMSAGLLRTSPCPFCASSPKPPTSISSAGATIAFAHGRSSDPGGARLDRRPGLQPGHRFHRRRPDGGQVGAGHRHRQDAVRRRAGSASRRRSCNISAAANAMPRPTPAFSFAFSRMQTSPARRRRTGSRKSSAPATPSARTEVVGPQVSHELFNDGVLATVLAIVFISLYVAFRFEWQYGIGALIATGHDVFVTAGMFSVLHIDFTLNSRCRAAAARRLFDQRHGRRVRPHPREPAQVQAHAADRIDQSVDQPDRRRERLLFRRRPRSTMLPLLLYRRTRTVRIQRAPFSSAFWSERSRRPMSRPHCCSTCPRLPAASSPARPKRTPRSTAGTSRACR